MIIHEDNNFIYYKEIISKDSLVLMNRQGVITEMLEMSTINETNTHDQYHIEPVDYLYSYIIIRNLPLNRMGQLVVDNKSWSKV